MSNKETSHKETTKHKLAPDDSKASNSPPSDQAMATRWEELRTAIRGQWPSLSAQDLTLIDGDSRKLIALVHQKTGADVSEIEAQIDEIAASSEGLLERVNRSVQSAVSQASEAATQASEAIREPVSQAYHAVEAQVTAAPCRASGIAFGTGLLVGLCTASMLKDALAPRKTSYFEGW